MSETPDRTVEAFLALVAERGFAHVTLADVAKAASLGVGELYRLHPDKVSLVTSFMRGVDSQVLADTPRDPDPEETPRDRLFDVMMRRYDALRPHRDALREIRHAAVRDPLLALALGPALMRSMGAMLEAAALPSDGLVGALRQNGLLTIHYAVSRTFERDETGDLSKTMAALDHRLKAAERWSQLFERKRVSPRTRESDATVR
ncbi:TetR/AcrR family transcriptional regulator [Reyranella sp.]|jgi:AcrR family transcriptional regulator|uniref:TetR/AcrR family transcriptional regulator n=1 Tax=Reyranella sp. TaxID=1929291 RepID=UPI002F92362D